MEEMRKRGSGRERQSGLCLVEWAGEAAVVIGLLDPSTSLLPQCGRLTAVPSHGTTFQCTQGGEDRTNQTYKLIHISYKKNFITANTSLTTATRAKKERKENIYICPRYSASITIKQKYLYNKDSIIILCKYSC